MMKRYTLCGIRGQIALLVSCSFQQVAALGPVFGVDGNCLQLDTRADGTTAIIDTKNTSLPDLNANLREVRVALIGAGTTNQSPFDGIATIAGPGSRFYYSTPDVVMGTDGGNAVFVEKVTVDGDDTDEHLVRLLRLDASGHPPTNETTVAGVDEWYVDPTARVHMNRSGQTAVVFFDQAYLGDHYARVRLYDSLGSPVGSAVTLNDIPRGDNGKLAALSPVVAVAPNGSVIVAWDDTYLGRNSSYRLGGKNVYFRIVGSTGALATSQVQVNTPTASSCSSPEIAVASDGHFVIVWYQADTASLRRIYARRYTADGTPLETGRPVSVTTGGDPQVAMGSNGCHVVVWTGADGDGNGIFAQRFGAGGEPVGLTLLINEGLTTGEQSDPLVGLSDGGDAIVVWTSQGSRWARWVPWDATNAEPAYGPRVVSFGSVISAGSVQSLNIEFDRPIDPETLTPADVVLTDPRGNTDAPVTAIQTANNTLFSVELSGVTLPGQYAVRVGPNVLDTSGAAMDQDMNTVKAAATDAYTNAFVVAPWGLDAAPHAEGFEGGVSSLTSWSFDFRSGDSVAIQTGSSRTGTNCLAFYNRGGTIPAGGRSIDSVWAVDSSAVSNTDTRLSFWVRKGASYHNGSLYVQIGTDLETWATVFTSLVNALPYSYSNYQVDLDAVIRQSSLPVSQRLYVRFLHTIPYSPYNQSASQFLVDDISIVVEPLSLHLIAATGGAARIAWPLPAGGWVCQTNSDLSSSSWGDILQAPVVEGSNCWMEVRPDSERLFYRLRWR